MTLYHFKDALKNFVIQIELRRLSPLFTLQTEQQQQVDENIQNISEPEFENWQFKWQEKAFSQFEEELYSDDRNCFTPLTRGYHERIVQMREIGTRPNGRLFSYTDADNFNDVTQINPAILSDNSLNARKGVILKTTVKTQGKTVNSPVENLPLKTMEIKSKIVMNLMVDLRRKNSTIPDEKVLCTLTLIEDGVLRVNPDFSDKWLRIESCVGDTWEYKLIHNSELPTRKDIEREENILDEIFERQQKALSNVIGHEKFFQPEIDTDEAIYHIFGEISSCHGFTKSSAYLRYKLALPNVFQLLSGDVEECYTNQGSHSFSLSSYFTPQAINIGHIFEYKFKGPLNYFDRPTLIRPMLLFEVNSFDQWGRHSNLGYGSVLVNLAPGIHSETVTTWKLAPRTKWEELSEYFLGITPVLGNLDRIRFPFEFGDQFLSKLGWKTQTSGQVEIKLQIIRHKFGAKKEVKIEKPQREGVMESSARAIAAFKAMRKKIQLDRPRNEL